MVGQVNATAAFSAAQQPLDAACVAQGHRADLEQLQPEDPGLRPRQFRPRQPWQPGRARSPAKTHWRWDGRAVSSLTAAGFKKKRSGSPRRRARSDAPYRAVRQGGLLQRISQRQFGVDERGEGRLNFCCQAKGAASRSDRWKLASYEMAGNASDKFVRPERTMDSAVPSGRISFVR